MWCFIRVTSLLWIVREEADTHPWAVAHSSSRWERNNVTELARFENYFETDAEGNGCPLWSVSSAIRSRKTVYV